MVLALDGEGVTVMAHTIAGRKRDHTSGCRSRRERACCFTIGAAVYRGPEHVIGNIGRPVGFREKRLPRSCSNASSLRGCGDSSSLSIAGVIHQWTPRFATIARPIIRASR